MRYIPGYEWLYSATEDWNIYSHITNKFLKGTDNTHWYYMVTLCKKGIHKKYTIHRLVIFSFLWKSNLCINHKNWIKTDNRIENLEYCTYSENSIHSRVVLWNTNSCKQRILASNMWKLNSKPITQYSLSWEFIWHYNSQTEASKKLWIPQATISRWIIKNKISGWFIWKLSNWKQLI